MGIVVGLATRATHVLKAHRNGSYSGIMNVEDGLIKVL